MSTPLQQAASAFCNVPNGSITNEQWGRADQALIIDIAAYLGSIKQMRNVAMARTVNVGAGNVVTDMSFVLPVAANGAAPSSYQYNPAPGNIATLITASLPVHLYMSTPNVEKLDLGQVTMLILTSPITGLYFVNDGGQGTTEIKLVVC